MVMQQVRHLQPGNQALLILEFQCMRKILFVNIYIYVHAYVRRYIDI